MAAPSTYKLLLQAQQAIKQLQRDLWISKGFTLQQAMDMARALPGEGKMVLLLNDLTDNY